MKRDYKPTSEADRVKIARFSELLRSANQAELARVRAEGMMLHARAKLFGFKAIHAPG